MCVYLYIKNNYTQYTHIYYVNTFILDAIITINRLTVLIYIYIYIYLISRYWQLLKSYILFMLF